ncbi:MAG: hypothetical protein IKR69_05275 [Bacteroidales bacterium]|nr:hypothetical protein [Bacteroidales bacterium]
MKRFMVIIFLALGSVAALGRGKDYTPFERGVGNFQKSVFIPKGTTGFGISASYTSMSLGEGSDNGFTLLYPVLGGLKGSLTTGSVTPSFEYFVADNVSVGARFSYGRTGLVFDKAALSVGELLSMNLGDIDYVTHSYTGAISVRDYLPVFNSKRFAVIVEGRLSGGYSQTKMSLVEDGLKHGTYQESFKGSLSCVPGVCLFILDNIDFEVQLGVLGVNFEKSLQTENQVSRSEAKSFNAALKINLLSVELGVKCYILDKYHRPRKKK